MKSIKNGFYGHSTYIPARLTNSMVNSQEVRLPFLDKKLIDFTNNIKPELGDNHRELNIS